MPITLRSTPATDPEVLTAAILPVQCGEQTEWAQEQLVSVPFMEAHMQPGVDNRLGGSYITQAQVTQIENVSCYISTLNSDVIMQEYLRNHFKWLNDKVYGTFKELFEGINIDSMKEALMKVSICNNSIGKFVDEINSKYGMALTFTTLEPCELGHWAETFQVVCGNSKAPKSPRLLQPHEEHCSSVQMNPYNSAHKQLQSSHNK